MHPPTAETRAGARADWRDPRYQAFALMRLAFTVAPIAFGLDKFFNVMVDWPIYLAPWINDIAPGSGQEFMYFVGATEILAGIIVALKPRYGAYVVAAWLGRDRHQPAHPLRLLRHRPARLRTHARRPDPRTSRLRLRPPAATRPPVSPCPPRPLLRTGPRADRGREGWRGWRRSWRCGRWPQIASRSRCSRPS